MRILYATSELYPFVKTGGLADVAAGLPPALQKAGMDVRYFLPGYPAVMKALKKPKVIKSFPDLLGAKDAELLLGPLPDGTFAYVLNAPSLFMRPHPYLDQVGRDWSDNHLRFGAFSFVAANLGQYDSTWAPQIIHGNDWQCGLIPVYMHFKRAPLTPNILTIHNLGYQGLFPARTLEELQLPPESFNVHGLEYYDQVGFLKGGLYYSTHVTTVSPTYAAEICSAPIGCGLEGLLASRRKSLTGILNGIDLTVWNPESDAALLQPYSARALAPKKKSKKALLRELGFKDRDDQPFFAFIGRLTPQKGLDILLQAAERLLDNNCTLFIVGSGDADLETGCCELAKAHPDRFVVHIGYNEELAHRLYAGADALIVPSHFEPCGLVQMYGLRYGTLPIVRRTGGLADSVTDDTGFLFDDPTGPELEKILIKAVDMYRNDPDGWKKKQKNAMAQNFGWDNSAGKYVNLYKSLAI